MANIQAPNISAPGVSEGISTVYDNSFRESTPTSEVSSQAQGVPRSEKKVAEQEKETTSKPKESDNQVEKSFKQGDERAEQWGKTTEQLQPAGSTIEADLPEKTEFHPADIKLMDEDVVSVASLPQRHNDYGNSSNRGLYDDIREGDNAEALESIRMFSRYLRSMEWRVADIERLVKERRLGSTSDSVPEIEIARLDPSKVPPTVEDDCMISSIRRCKASTWIELHDLPHVVEKDINDKYEKKAENDSKRSEVEHELRSLLKQKEGGHTEKFEHGAHSCRHVVEILVDEGTSSKPRASSAKSVKTATWSEKPEPAGNTQAGYPQRIRIRGKRLLELLDRLEAPQPDREYPDTSVWVHPFGFFCVYAEEIRNMYKELETEVKELEQRVDKEREKDTAATKDVLDNNTTNAEGRVVLDSGAEKSALKEETKLSRKDVGALRDQSPLPSSSPPPPTGAGPLEIKRRLLEHLGVVVKLLDTDLKPTLDNHHRLQETTPRTIAFKDLWHLFKHCEDVRVTNDETQIYRVWDFTGGREIIYEEVADDGVPEFSKMMRQGAPGAFYIECLHYVFNGYLYAPSYKTFTIRKYDGEREITQLPIYPLRFDGDQQEQRQPFIARGKRFMELSRIDQISHKYYSDLSYGEEPKEIDSEIIIDTKFALLINKSWVQPFLPPYLAHDPRESFGPDAEGLGRDLRKEVYYSDHKLHQRLASEEQKKWPVVKATDSLDEFGPDDCILFPPFVYGFALRSREWMILKIDSIKDLTYDNSFDNLVLPEGHKNKVLALVENRAKSDKREERLTMDIVTGKGKGLVILLHGEPGVGKTSTAECVATYTNRPLFPITCGDLGETAAEVSDTLERNFAWAYRWGCVLLLDEADVFLAERTRQELQRNAIVSVFLRALEYYSGILFLTTNRVGAFDPAFKSRIHLSLYYPRLDKRATIKIWRMHINRAKTLYKKSGKPFKVKRDEILDFASQHFEDLSRSTVGCWNGRQIRNAFQTAIALAEYKAKGTLGAVPTLAEEQFQDVADASREFDEYMRMTVGMNDRDRARHTRYRADTYEDDKGRERDREKASRKSRGKAAAGSPPPRKSKTKRKSVETESEQESESPESEHSVDDRAAKSGKSSRAPLREKGASTREPAKVEDASSDSDDSDDSDAGKAKRSTSKSREKDK